MYFGKSSNNDIANLFYCEGTFDFNGIKNENIFFDLVQYNDAKVDIYISYNNFSPIKTLIEQVINLHKDSCSINGSLVDKDCKFEIKEAILSKFKFKYEKNSFILKFAFRVYSPIEIVFNEDNSKEKNILVGLTNFIHDNNAKDPTFIRFRITTEDFTASFNEINGYGEYKELMADNNELYFVTSEMNIKTQKNNIENEICLLTDLLSFSKGTHTTAIYEFYHNENGITKIILRPIVTGNYFKNDFLIPNENLPNFLEECYTEYKNNHESFSLQLALGFYLESLKSKYDEEKYLLASTCLETILSSYENLCKQKENPIIPNSIKRTEKEIKKYLNENNITLLEENIEELSKRISYNQPSLIDKLNAMKLEYNIKLEKYDYDMPQIRNKITHTGRIPKIINSSKGEREIYSYVEFNRLIYLIDRILLSILNYNGTYLNRIENQYTDKKK